MSSTINNAETAEGRLWVSGVIGSTFVYRGSIPFYDCWEHDVKSAGSTPASLMCPGRSRIAGSTSGHCPAKIKMICGIEHINRT